MTMSESDAVLAARALSKDYSSGGTTTRVLSQLDLSVCAGESVAIMGASGSGKTTLLHLLGGLDRPTAGQVFVRGRDLATLSDDDISRWRNRHLAFIFQFHLLLPEFSVLENTAMPLLLRRVDKSEALAAAADCLRLVGLDAHANKLPAQLSGGERQRAAVARALTGAPDCILADEPTGNLDRNNAERVFDQLLFACTERRATLLLVTHDERLAVAMQRHLILENGRFAR